MEKRDKEMPYEVIIQERNKVDLYGNVVYYIYWFDKYGNDITNEWKFWSKGPKKKYDRVRMLYSFRNGPKSGLKVADPDDNYKWTNKDGNEKYSTKNLPKAHFRWDWRRYTLSKESVDKITEFVDTILKS